MKYFWSLLVNGLYWLLGILVLYGFFILISGIFTNDKIKLQASKDNLFLLQNQISKLEEKLIDTLSLIETDAEKEAALLEYRASIIESKIDSVSFKIDNLEYKLSILENKFDKLLRSGY